MTKPRDMYDLTSHPTDTPEIKAKLKQAIKLYNEVGRDRASNNLPALAAAFAARKRKQTK
jgi:hypothetical protein